jgi:hypothetical protein
MGVYGAFGFYNPKKSRKAPYFYFFFRFSDYKIRISEKLICFHSITIEKLSSDSKIQKLQGHFWKKKKTQGARELHNVGKVIVKNCYCGKLTYQSGMNNFFYIYDALNFF